MGKGPWKPFSPSPTLAPHLWEAKASVRPYRLCRSWCAQAGTGSDWAQMVAAGGVPPTTPGEEGLFPWSLCPAGWCPHILEPLGTGYSLHFSKDRTRWCHSTLCRPRLHLCLLLNQLLLERPSERSRSTGLVITWLRSPHGNLTPVPGSCYPSASQKPGLQKHPNPEKEIP